jgi:aminoglycoside phosphotransferase (APT) family kinase protein
MHTLSCQALIDRPEEIELLLQAAIGVQTRLVDCQVAKQGQDYCVLLARLRKPKLEVVVKLAGPGAKMASQFDRTVSIHQMVAKGTDIPLPEIIAADISYQKWPWRYLISTYLPGKEWATIQSQMDPADLRNAYRQLGKAIGQLHCIAFPSIGEINASGQVEQPDPSCLSALRRRALKLIRSPRLQYAFLVALEQRSDCFERVAESRLCHEDLHGYNILFAHLAGEWRLATILDFDKAWAGPPETDLARLELWKGMTSPDFWAAYRLYRSLEDGYVQRRPVYQLLWCLEYASQTQEHLIDTQRVCQELGIPVLHSLAGPD